MSTPTEWQTPKKDWSAVDGPLPSDFNRIEGNIDAIETGARTIDPTQVPTSNNGTLRNFLNWFANRIKAITGKANWWDAPATTLENAAAHINATTGVHGATSAATPNTLVQRDANGRFKAAAPSASDDVARKAETDAALSAAQAAAAVADAAFAPKPALPSNANWNDYTTNGTYLFGGTSGHTNGPGLDWGTLAVYNSFSYIVQVAYQQIPVGGGVVKYRTRNESNTWSPWMTIITSADGQTINGVLNAKVLVSTNSEGNEGGEINLAKPASGTSLAGQVTIDVFGNLLRIFDSGGSARGAALDLTAQQTGVGSRIWTTAALRWNSGRLEYNNGGVWTPVGGIKNVQRGTATIGASGNVTISAVDMNKSFVTWSFRTATSWEQKDLNYTIRLTSPTNIEFMSGGNTGNADRTIAYEVVESY